MKFEDAVEYILKFEGEYSNDIADRGGETKYGISARAHPNVDIAKLTREQAIEIYRKEYWEPNQDILKIFISWYIDDYIFCAKIFDCIVNIGRKNTVIVIQRSLNSLISKKLKEDGMFGDKTKQSLTLYLSTVYAYAVEVAFRCERAAYYRVLAAKDPSQEKFLRGWLLRSYS